MDNVEHGSKGNNGSYGAAVWGNTEKFVSLHRKPQENGLPRKRIFALFRWRETGHFTKVY